MNATERNAFELGRDHERLRVDVLHIERPDGLSDELWHEVKTETYRWLQAEVVNVQAGGQVVRRAEVSERVDNLGRGLREAIDRLKRLEDRLSAEADA